jgi:multidrug efflux pump
MPAWRSCSSRRPSVVLEDADVATLSSVVGVDAANNTMLHTGSMLINLKRKRSGSQQETMDRLRNRVAAIPA